MDSALEIPGSSLIATVIVRIARDAHLGGTFNKRLTDGMDQIKIGDRHLTVSPTHRVVTWPNAPLGAFKIGQYIAVTPTRVAHLRPVVVVRTLTAHIIQSVDRTRPAKHTALR